MDRRIKNIYKAVLAYKMKLVQEDIVDEPSLNPCIMIDSEGDYTPQDLFPLLNYLGDR